MRLWFGPLVLLSPLLAVAFEVFGVFLVDNASAERNWEVVSRVRKVVASFLTTGR